jgi:cytoskeletal protein CcmA (bactofilin family)
MSFMRDDVSRDKTLVIRALTWAQGDRHNGAVSPREDWLLRSVRRFFGFDASDEDDLRKGFARPAAAPSAAFRIGEKLSIKGEIAGEGDLELAGKFEGVIDVRGTVVVADRAEVDADITASTIVVAGRVRGNLSASGRVDILPQGVLTGNLKTGSLTAADGASLKGEVVIERGAKSRVEGSGT